VGCSSVVGGYCGFCGRLRDRVRGRCELFVSGLCACFCPDVGMGWLGGLLLAARRLGGREGMSGGSRKLRVAFCLFYLQFSFRSVVCVFCVSGCVRAVFGAYLCVFESGLPGAESAGGGGWLAVWCVGLV